MKTKQIILKAVNELVDFVKPTFGPNGKKVILQKGFKFEALDDGVSIAKQFKSKDAYENAVIEFVKEVAIKTNDKVGDGTTGSLIILQSLVNQLSEKYEEIDLTQFKKGIKKLSKQITSKKELEQIAFVSYNDEKMAKVIADMVDQVGKDGLVSVEESDSIETKTEVVNGMELDNGYVSSYMATNDRLEAIWEKSPILVTDKKITAIHDILPLIESIAQTGTKNLVIIADEIEGEALTTFVVNKLKGTFSVLGIKAPHFGERKREFLEDIATLTEAQLVSELKGLNFNSPNILGYAEKVIATAHNTIILGTKGNIDTRVTELKAQLGGIKDEFDKDFLKRRIAKLTNGIGLIKVGAATESEMKFKKYKVEDAVNATQIALKGGYIKGAGVGLSLVETGSEILNKALKSPKEQLNLEADVIDPTEVMIAQVETAVSIAKVLMNCSGILLEEKE